MLPNHSNKSLSFSIDPSARVMNDEWDVRWPLKASLSFSFRNERRAGRKKSWAIKLFHAITFLPQTDSFAFHSTLLDQNSKENSTYIYFLSEIMDCALPSFYHNKKAFLKTNQSYEKCTFRLILCILSFTYILVQLRQNILATLRVLTKEKTATSIINCFWEELLVSFRLIFGDKWCGKNAFV